MQTHDTPTTDQKPGRTSRPMDATGSSRQTTRQTKQRGPHGIVRQAKRLGWLSLGVGVAQLSAPQRIAQLIGVRNDARTRRTLRVLGGREIAAGLGILTQRKRARWVWARLVGDVMDMALLGMALNAKRAKTRRLVASTAVVLGVGALDYAIGRQLSRQREASMPRPRRLRPRGVPIARAITVVASPDQAYRLWRDFTNVPRFMPQFKAVEARGADRVHWVASGPAGMTVEWDAEITDDAPNERIAWRSLEGAPISNWGAVHFTPGPGGEGTIVRLEIDFEPPGGALGARLARLFGAVPALQMQNDLRRFKQLLELGEVVQSDASVHGVNP